MDISKKIILIIFLTGFPAALLAQVCPIIPMPVSAQKLSGNFTLKNGTSIQTNNAALQTLAVYLQKKISSDLRITTEIKNQPGKNIVLILSTEKNTPPGAYQLNISPQKISIKAAGKSGVFYGIVSLLQIVQQSKARLAKIKIPAWQISDAPAYAWRGFMLDESRHFFGMEKVKQLLDWMAYYKLNRFHWHLTDGSGWRMEIKKYPRLTTIGGRGNFTDSTAVPKFYTQNELKEIVAYAAERNIEVFPEIDMPGHATAAIKAYPQYNGGGSKQYPNFTFHPAKTETYTFLTNILKEIAAVFPSKMLHIGGDEVSFGNEKWLADTDVQHLMKNQNLQNVQQVEQYFMRRMADSVQKIGAKLLLWDEAVDAGVSPKNTRIFWWRQDQPQQLQKALTAGYTTVICPRLPFYFDFVQDGTHKTGRRWAGKYNDLEKVYNFSVPEISKEKHNLILGLQANLWTETVTSEKRFDYLVFPRMSALAEAAWTPKNKRNYTDFSLRLNKQFPFYDAAGIYYYDFINPKRHPEPPK